LIIGLLLAPLAAWAGGGKEESVKADRPAGATSGASTSGIQGGDVAAAPDTDVTTTRNSRSRLIDDVEQKRWEVLVGYEVHRMWIQTDLGGDAPNRLFNYWYAAARFDITRQDRLRLRFGVYERFLADSGETGLRTDDLSLSYTHIFKSLPWRLNLSATVGATAPVSFYSQKMGLITALSGSVDLSRSVAFLTFAVRPYGVFYWQRYDSSEGGNANPIGRVGVSADAWAELPFFPDLAIGVDGYSSYSWFYTPQGALPADQFPGTVNDPTYSSQTMQQSYGGEVYVRYTAPPLWGVKAEVTLAVANGDPSLGYTSRLHDGVSYFYVFNRHTAEIYGNLTLRY
jgi:hypothetical protein